MKVVHFSTHTGLGGAAKAAERLHRALLDAGCESSLISAFQVADIPQTVSVRTRYARFSRAIDNRIHRILNPQTTFFPDLLGTPTASLIDRVDHPQIIHLHWVAQLLTSRQIRQLYQKTRAPIVWTLMDMAPLTGGCHYAWGCTGYQASCGRCPQIRSDFACDLSRWTWWRKRNNLGTLPITIVAGSNWIADRARESSLFGNSRIVPIRVGIDDRLFSPVNSKSIREHWGLPTDARVIFFGSDLLSDERKGMRYLLEALNVLKIRLTESGSDLNIVLLIAGKRLEGHDLQLPFPAHLLGYLEGEHALAMAYQAADICVSPSIQDAGPMTIPESMLCGTPVVAFHSGGAPDWIKTMENGYLAKYKDSADLANGMYLLLSNSNFAAMRVAARASVEGVHTPSIIAGQYLDVYHSLVQN